MFQFGVGQLYLNPVGGNLTANPTPIQPLTVQDISLDITQEMKELIGQNKLADDIAPGAMKISGKFTYGRIDIDLWNNIFFAETRTTGIKQIVPREAQTIAAVSPYTVNVTHQSGYGTDLGVVYSSSGVALLRVSSAPTQGQYSVNVSTGVYTFNSADANVAVLISYVYTPSPNTTGRTVTLSNQLMGYGPIFELWLAEPYQQVNGLNNGVHLYSCRVGKLSQSLKNNDYSKPEMDYMAFANAAGQIGELFQVAA